MNNHNNEVVGAAVAGNAQMKINPSADDIE